VQLSKLLSGVFLSTALAATAAYAQLRTIPPDAQRGEMRHLQDMIVEINGAPRRLAAGAQIRDAANRIVVPTSVAAKTQVRFVVDAEGLVRRVWILTAEEAAKR